LSEKEAYQLVLHIQCNIVNYIIPCTVLPVYMKTRN